MISIAETPKSLKIILKVIVCSTLLLLVLESFFALPVRELFFLNPLFYEHFFLWQPITAACTLQVSSLSFSELLDATFLLLLFWITSLEVYLSFGARRYSILIASVLAASTAAALITMYLFGLTASLSLLSQVVLACTTVWAICPTRVTPASMLFFPLPSKYVLAIAILATVGYNAITHEYVRAAAFTASFVTSYIIAIGCWFLPGPFSCCYRLDAFLRRTYSALFRLGAAKR